MAHEIRLGSTRIVPGTVDEQVEVRFTEIVKQLAPGEALRIKAVPPPEQPPVRLDVVVQEDDGEP